MPNNKKFLKQYPRLLQQNISRLVVLSLLGACISGWVQPIVKVMALNQVNNWAFTGNATGWSSTNGQGSNTCGTDTSASVTAYPTATFAYSGNTWSTTTASNTNATYRGMIYQSFTAPGSGISPVSGRVDYVATLAGQGNGWVRLDVYNSTNTNFVANLSCETYNSSQSLHSTPIGTATLSGGTTYTLRVTLSSISINKKIITLAVDNVVVSIPPIGLSASTSGGSPNVNLSWTASTGTPAEHASNPYKVYRSTSTPVTTSNFLANATTNSYTDTTATGGTRYYYAVTNVDVNSVESPLSAESNVLTYPGTPGTPTFSNIQYTTLTVSWSENDGSTTTYTLERCMNTGCNNFSQVASGITQATYNDTNLAPGTVYRYRVYGVNATGNGPYSSEATVTTNASISVSISTDGTIDYSVMLPGGTKSTLDLSDTQTVTNDGNVTESFNIKTSSPTGGVTWSPSTSPGHDIYVHQYSTNGGSLWNTFVSPDSYELLVSNLSPGSTRNVDFRLTVPLTSSDYQQKTIIVTIQAVQQ